MTQNEIAELAPSRSGVSLIGVSPDSTLVALDRYEQRTAAVQPEVLPSFREGYGQVGPITVAPESVIIGGAARVIRTISSWPTERMTFTDLRAPLEADVPIRLSEDVPLAFSTPTVHISINVQPFAEKFLGGIPVEAVEIPPSREIIFIPPRVDLVARGGIKQLAGLSPADVQVRVSYDALLTDTTGTVDPVVTGPAGIQFVSKKPERLQYVIRKRL
jgi:YbbR domain-containing protein